MLERRGILALATAAGIGAGTAGFAKRLVEMIPLTSQGRKALHPVYGNANTPEWLRDAKTGALRPKRLIAETCDGGRIFADTGDPKSKDIEVLGFRGLYARRTEMMDPKAPEPGHRTNGLIFQGGRIVGSRMLFAQRFVHSFGSVNVFDHVNVCELSHHVATRHIYPGVNMTQPDVREAKFIIYWGTQPGDANFPMLLRSAMGIVPLGRTAIRPTVAERFPVRRTHQSEEGSRPWQSERRRHRNPPCRQGLHGWRRAIRHYGRPMPSLANVAPRRDHWYRGNGAW